MAKNALGTPSPHSQRPLEKTSQMEECPWSKDGNEDMDVCVSASAFPEGSDGQFAQKHQQKGHSDASGFSWWEWRWIFRGFLTGQQAKEGEIQGVYFGLRHAELNHK